MFCQIRNKAKEGRSFGNTLKWKEGRSLGNGGSNGLVAKLSHFNSKVMCLNLNNYYLRFFLIVTLWHFTLFTNCTLTLVCDLYVNKNIVMWNLVRFVLVCILLICSFYIFYKYKIRDIKARSSASACVKSVSVTIKKKRR